MTKSGSNKDTGYIAALDQLWLWVNSLKSKAEASIRGRVPGRALFRVRDSPKLQLSVYSESVGSGGGPIFQGNLSVGTIFHVS